MTDTESNDGSAEIDKLLAELKDETLPEESDNSKKDIKELKWDDSIDTKTERNEDNTW